MFDGRFSETKDGQITTVRTYYTTFSQIGGCCETGRDVHDACTCWGLTIQTLFLRHHTYYLTTQLPLLILAQL